MGEIHKGSNVITVVKWGLNILLLMKVRKIPTPFPTALLHSTLKNINTSSYVSDIPFFILIMKKLLPKVLSISKAMS